MDSKNIGKLVLIGLAIAGIYYLITTYSKKPVVSIEKFAEDSSDDYLGKNGSGKKDDEVEKFAEDSSDDYLGGKYGSGKKDDEIEKFADSYGIQPSQSYGSNEIYQMLDQSSGSSVQGNAYPADCFPKDQLTPAELLPADANSKWAQSVPSGQGELGDQNFLTAGYHIGVNTVGQTLRNANRQLRSEPLNPQQKVSPWLQTTIEPDVNRRPMEIGGCQ
jgi:hypothetical protein